MTVHGKMERLVGKIGNECRNIERKSIEKFLDGIENGKRIFVIGAGRSGLVARSFAMRLMHLGFKVHVVGETTTPAIERDDLLLAISGSGKTYSVTGPAKTAKSKGAKIATITSDPKSKLGRISDYIIQIKGRQKEDQNRDYLSRQMGGEHEPTSPLGTLFEVSAMVFLDSMIAELMSRYNKSEEYMKKLHTNLE